MSKLRLGLVFVAVAAAFASIVVWFVRREATVAPASVVAPTTKTTERELESVSMLVERGKATSVQLAEDEVPSGHGLLRLKVSAHESGAPVADSRWRVVRANASSESELAASVTEFGRYSVRTDAQGRAEFTLPAGIDWKLLSGPPDDVEQLVPALAEREARELTLRVGPTADDWFVARVVDADTKRPIEGAQFSPLSRFAQLLEKLDVGAVSDSRGEVRIDVRRWSPFDALVRADGYSPRAIPVGRNCANSAQDVELKRVGPLEVVIEGFPSLRKEMRVEVAFSRGSLFSGPANGRAEQRVFVALPIDEASRATLRSPPIDEEIEILARVLPNDAVRQTARLSEGESATIRFDFRRNSLISGLVQSRGAHPAEGVELRFARVRDFALPESDESSSLDVESLVRTTVADALGQFRLDDVPAGEWIVGTDEDRVRQWVRAATPIVAHVDAQRFRVTGDGQPISLSLDGVVGWPVVGRVADSADRPVPNAQLEMTSSRTHAVQRIKLNDAGTFALGPFANERITLAATVAVESSDVGMRFLGYYEEPAAETRSASVVIEGPASDVVLRLPRPCRVRGGFADANIGIATVATFELMTETERRGRVISNDAPHRFDFAGATPGRYRVIARIEEPTRLVGMSPPFELAEGESVADVTVELESPATIVLDRDAMDRGEREMYRVDVGSAFVGVLWQLGPLDEAEADGFESFVSSDLEAPSGHVRIWRIPQRRLDDENAVLCADFEITAGQRRILRLPH